MECARPRCTLHASEASEADSGSHTLFPLTPTLSLGERGPSYAAFGDSEGFGSSRDGKWFSLSPRERVGVRGKCAFDNLAPAVVEDPCKVQRPPAQQLPNG